MIEFVGRTLHCSSITEHVFTFIEVFISVERHEAYIWTYVKHINNIISPIIQLAKCYFDTVASLIHHVTVYGQFDNM